MAVCQNLVPLVNIKIAGKWMFIPLKMVLIGIDPYPYCWWWITSYYIWLVVDLPPEKYESQIGSSSQLLGKIENVPNHQPVILRTSIYLLHLTSISSFVLILMIIQKKNVVVTDQARWNRSQSIRQIWVPNRWSEQNETTKQLMSRYHHLCPLQPFRLVLPCRIGWFNFSTHTTRLISYNRYNRNKPEVF